MIRSILVPLDGSPLGEQALPYARAVARRTGAHVRVAHVHVRVDPIRPDWPLPEDERWDAEARSHQLAYLDGVVRELAASGVSASSALLEGGVESALCGHAAECRADLVVMTTHGRGPFSRFWLGSVADALVHRLTVPLLLVRARREAPDRAADPPLRRVLIPLDGSPCSEAALGAVAALGTAGGVEYTLLRAVAPPPALGWEVAGYGARVEADLLANERRDEAGMYLAGVAKRLRSPEVRVQTRAVLHPSAAGAILEAEAGGDFDWIALGTRARTGAARLLLGSVADKVVRGAAIPVLVCRGAAPAAKEARHAAGETAAAPG
jgi:nucleotide-binding universal stress UspA family protein